MPRPLRLLIPALAVVLAFATSAATAAKVINGRSIKNGSVTERKLSPAVRGKLNAPGPQGPQGPQGVQGVQGPPGPAAPGVGSAVAQTTAIAPLALDSSATILTLSSPPGSGTGLVTVTGPARLMITGQVNAFKTTANFDKLARVHCQLLHEDTGGLDPVGDEVEATLGAVSIGAVLVSLSLVGSVDVDAGPHDVGIRCEAKLASTNVGVSFQNASLNVVAVPR
jgi:hypothetical protein